MLIDSTRKRLQPDRTEDGQVSSRNGTKTLILGITTLLIAALLVLLAATFFVTVGGMVNVIRLVLVLLLIPLCVLLIILRIFFSSLDHVDSKARMIAKGNLNVSDILIEKTRGLENLTLAFNDMKSNFLSFIELTKGNVVVLSDAIEQVSTSIEMNYAGNEQIASSMNQVAEKAQQQLSLVKDTIADVENSSAKIKKITDSIEQIEGYIEGTAKTSEESTRDLDLFYTQLNTMSDYLDRTNRFMQELNGEIGKISSIGEFIIQVSEQLKLLSLNASIEAARAGEAGKGFAVVSNQIRDLSAKTQDSMKKIDGIVNEIKKSSENVNTSIGGFINNFNESREVFVKVKESFNSINEQSGTINNGMKGIYGEINLINSFNLETKEKGIQLHAASDDISSKTQDVAAVTEEALAGLEGITGQTASLNDMLVNIQKLVNRFNTSVLPVKNTSGRKLKFAFLSISNNVFWDAIRRGVTYAQKELAKENAVIDYFAFDGEVLMESTYKKMKECIDEGYDGIALPGFLGKAAPLVEEAWRKNIPVMTFNCDFEAKTPRLASFITNNYEGGTMVGNLLAKAMNNSGDILIVKGKTEVSRNRRDGAVDVFKKHGKLKVVDELETDDRTQLIYETVIGYMKTHNNIQGICVAAGGVGGAAKALEELGLAGKVKLVGFDTTRETLVCVKRGSVYGTVGQDTFGQGHDPMIWLYNYTLTGEKTPSEIMYLRSNTVDGRTVDDLLTIQ